MSTGGQRRSISIRPLGLAGSGALLPFRYRQRMTRKTVHRILKLQGWFVHQLAWSRSDAVCG